MPLQPIDEPRFHFTHPSGAMLNVVETLTANVESYVTTQSERTSQEAGTLLCTDGLTIMQYIGQAFEAGAIEAWQMPTVVSIAVPEQEMDLSPWPAKLPDGTQTKGMALSYLQSTVIPTARYLNQMGPLSYMGFSLSGLFWLWSALECGTKLPQGSLLLASPSVWYPNFMSYTKSHDAKFVENIGGHSIYWCAGKDEGKGKPDPLPLQGPNTLLLMDRFAEQSKLDDLGHRDGAAHRIQKLLQMRYGHIRRPKDVHYISPSPKGVSKLRANAQARPHKMRRRGRLLETLDRRVAELEQSKVDPN